MGVYKNMVIKRLEYSKYLFILFLLLFLFFMPVNLVQAKTKSVNVGSSVTLTVKKDAKWYIKNKKIARLIVISPKKAKVVGLKKGTTVITAKTKNKKYKITVNVKKVKQKGDFVEEIVSQPISGTNDYNYFITNGRVVTGYFDEGYASNIIAGINSLRSSKGLNVLQQDNLLTQAAKIRSYESSVLMDHKRPDGRVYYSVSGTSEKNYKDSVVFGENLAWGYFDVGTLIEEWCDSPTHYANLIREGIKKVGVSVFMLKVDNTNYYPYIAMTIGY